MRRGGSAAAIAANEDAAGVLTRLMKPLNGLIDQRRIDVVNGLKQRGLVLFGVAHTRGSNQEEIQRAREIVLQVRAFHDAIQKSVLQQELASLETIRKFLAYGLLDDPRTGKSD